MTSWKTTAAATGIPAKPSIVKPNSFDQAKQINFAGGTCPRVTYQPWSFLCEVYMLSNILCGFFCFPPTVHPHVDQVDWDYVQARASPPRQTLKICPGRSLTSHQQVLSFDSAPRTDPCIQAALFLLPLVQNVHFVHQGYFFSVFGSRQLCQIFLPAD